MSSQDTLSKTQQHTTVCFSKKMRIITFFIFLLHEFVKGTEEGSIHSTHHHEHHIVDDAPVRIFYPSRYFTSPHIWSTKPAQKNEKLMKNTSYLDVRHAQDAEDIFLYENWFYGVEKGTILESGAYDGVQFSTSYLFAAFANWNAIHVEADPQSYQKLVHSRKDAININAGLCNVPSVLHYTTADARNINGFVEFMDKGFMGQWHNNLVQHPELINDLPKINCLPMKNLMPMIGITYVDIWILDVEGAELLVLKGTNFESFHANVIVMECDGNQNGEIDREKMKYLEGLNYNCHRVCKLFHSLSL